MAENKGGAKTCLNMAAGKREMKTKRKGFPLIKPSDLVRLTWNSMRETTPMIQLSPIVSLPQQMGIKTAQFKMKFGWGHRAKPYH